LYGSDISNDGAAVLSSGVVNAFDIALPILLKMLFGLGWPSAAVAEEADDWKC
jgi:hypothetical protein